MSDTAISAMPPGDDGTDSPPQPIPDVESSGFWRATARGVLALCRCAECRAWQHPPLERCRYCEGETAFEATNGRGRLHSFIVMHRASVPGQGPGPHILGLIELDDAPGVRVTGPVIRTEPQLIGVGDRVIARMVAVAGGPYHSPVFDHLPAVE